MIHIRQEEHSSPLWWFDNRNQLDLDPPYQRKSGIWKLPDRALLIDSILNGFDIPKFYVADFTSRSTELNLSRLPYAVIDGKQRFGALFDFFSDELALAKEFVLAEDPSRELGGMRYSDLRAEDPDLASRFMSYKLVVMSVLTDDEATINQLFVRLNRGLPLVGAEIRNAMVGKFPKLIRELVEHPFFQDYISFSTSRGQDLNAAGKLVLVEYSGELVSTKKNALDSLTEEMVPARSGRAPAGKDVLEDVERARDRVVEIVTLMTSMFRQKDSLLGSPGQLTVYYWLVRELGPDQGRALPEFLAEFEKARASNRKTLASLGDLNKVDRELLQFDFFNRSTNDVGSLRGRFEILYRRYTGETPSIGK